MNFFNSLINTSTNELEEQKASEPTEATALEANVVPKSLSLKPKSKGIVIYGEANDPPNLIIGVKNAPSAVV